MPRKDGTGPEGKGSRTGRGMGPCGTNGSASGAPNETGQDFSNDAGQGRGLGRGRGRGLGRGPRDGRGRGSGGGGGRGR